MCVHVHVHAWRGFLQQRCLACQVQRLHSECLTACRQAPRASLHADHACLAEGAAPNIIIMRSYGQVVIK